MAEENNASSHVVQEQSEVVAASNLKVVGEGPAFTTNLSYQQALHHQGMRHQQDLDASASWRMMQQAVATKAVEDLLATDVGESAGNLLAFGIGAKTVQTTPPVTAPAPAT